MFFRFFKKRRDGVAALPMILIISGIISTIAVSLAFFSFVSSNALLNSKASNEAIFAAQSGIDDAMLKIERDKTFSTATPYSLAVGRASASVVVTSYPLINTTIIDSTGTVFPGSVMMRQKKLQAKLSIDSTTGEVRVISILEVAI